MKFPEMKHICFFNSCKIWGGGEKWHYDMAMKFSQKGHKIFACTNVNSDLFHKFKICNIPVFEIKIRNLSFLNPWKIYRIYRYFQSREIDTVILGLPSDVKAAGIAAKLAGVKKIIYRRGTALPVKNSLLNRYLYRHVVTDVITNSFEIKKKFLQNNPSLFPQDQIHVIYNGIDIQENTRTSFLNGFPRPVILGNAGRLVEQKGQKYLVELAAYLKTKKIDFKIKIAGKGVLRQELIEYASRLNVIDYIEFLDFVTDMNSFFRSIDVFVLPSIHEGSANIVIEAMAHSIPVIAFYVSSNPELIDDSQNGFLVPFGDIQQLGDKSIELITKHEFRNRMGKAARKKVIEKFDVNNSIVQLEEIF